VGGQRHVLAALHPGKTRYPLYRRLGGPQGRSGQVRKNSSPPGCDPLTFQHLASRYTDRAIPAHCNLVHRCQLFPETCCPHPEFQNAETKAAGSFETTEQIYQTARRLFQEDVMSNHCRSQITSE